MEQKDYILREIEKIGKILQAITQKLFGGDNSYTSNFENEDAVANMLLNQLDFNIDKLDVLDNTALEEYIAKLSGFNYGNIENLAYLLLQIGFIPGFSKSQEYLTKSLRLYEYVNKKTRTFSLERENSIFTIKEALNIY